MRDLFRTYGLIGFIATLFSKLYTLISIKNGRLVRLPIDIRGKRHIDFGINLTTGKYCRIEALPHKDQEKKLLVFGSNIVMNDMVHIAAIESVIIGDNVLIASKVFISDHNHGSYSKDGTSPIVPPNNREIISKPVVIEDDVWIGEFVSILPGVTIGKGSIIGTMSVVNKNIPAYSIAVGSPAKVIKSYNFTIKQWEKI
jgi:acetyltransferase-like isoleucine patch superfamily enzyme